MEEKQYNGAITLLIDDKGCSIELFDETSRTTFVEVTLTPEQICQALGRLAHTKCQIKTNNLGNVGKKMIMDKIIFEVPDNDDYKDKKEVARKEVVKHCPNGWTPDLYFGSRDSFFTKDGKNYARTIIRKWE